MDNMTKELARVLVNWELWPIEEQKWWNNFSSKTDCVREQLENGIRLPDGSIGATCDLEKIWNQRTNTIDQMIGNGPVFAVAEGIRTMIFDAAIDDLMRVFEALQYHRSDSEIEEERLGQALNVVIMERIIHCGTGRLFCVNGGAA